MDDAPSRDLPPALAAIESDTAALGFDMPSERRTGALLAALAAGYPGGRLLEVGTGTGLATAWLLHGMDGGASLTSIDRDAQASAVAGKHLGGDPRLRLVVEDAIAWLARCDGPSFQLIFADAIAGKYEGFQQAWRLLAPGGSYVIDDMLPQANWPEGHAPRVARLLADLEARQDCRLVKLSWGSGVVLAVRR